MPTIDYSKLLWTPFGNSPTNTFDRNNAPLPGLTSRSVQTLRVDQNGNPIIPAAPGAIQPQSAADARSEQNLTRQNMWFTSQAPGGPSPAPQRSMVPNNWGTSVGRTFDPIWENNDPGTIMTAAAMPQIPGPSGFSNLNKSQDRLSQGTGLAFAGDNSQPPGLAAISGAMTPLPQMQPGMFGRGQPSMQWDPAVSTGPAPSGDPWSMRIGEQSLPSMPGMSTGPAEITIRGGSRSAPAPLPRPAFTNPSATYFDRSTGSFVTGKQPPPLPKRPTAAVKKQLKAQQNGGNQSPKPAGYGSKGYSEAGRALQALYGN